jgi:histone-arginine methyltransferase CARM1
MMSADDGTVTAKQEAMAQTFTFNGSELRWVATEGAPVLVRLVKADKGTLRLAIGSQEVAFSDVYSVSLVAPRFITVNMGKLGQVGLQFEDEAAAKEMNSELTRRKADYERFDQYEPNSVQSYFQYYAKLGNQQNMLQDSVRTGTYRRSIMENRSDFLGKTVMDIGAGSGILTFFSAQAGASTLYAVEASSVSEVVRLLADANQAQFPGSTIKVCDKPLEAIRDDEVPGKVDVLVSEPIGTFLFNERMIETYICARDRFLKPGGKMFPNAGNLCIAPFSDAMLHWEQQNKNSFWKNTSFHGIDLTAALSRSTKEHFRQPVVDYVNPECLVSKAHTVKFDFMTVTVESLHNIDIPFDFEIGSPCLVHGIAGWFDAIFDGSTTSVVLSTAPWCPGTHWYQIRFLLEVPLAVNAGQHIEGHVRMEANNLQSYYVKVFMKIKGTEISSEAACIDLKDPEYRFYTSPNAYCPPGTPSAWSQQGAQAGQAASVTPQQQHSYQQAAAQFAANGCSEGQNGAHMEVQ